MFWWPTMAAAAWPPFQSRPMDNCALRAFGHPAQGIERRCNSGRKGPRHSINLDPANRFAFAADLGLDKVLVYKFDPAKGRSSPTIRRAPTWRLAREPRHFAFHPRGNSPYGDHEITSTVTAFTYDASRGQLKEIQTITTLPTGFDGKKQFDRRGASSTRRVSSCTARIAATTASPFFRSVIRRPAS